MLKRHSALRKNNRSEKLKVCEQQGTEAGEKICDSQSTNTLVNT